MSDEHFAGKGLIPAWQRTETYKDGLRLVEEVNARKSERKLVYEAVLHGHTGDAYPLAPGQVIRMEQRHDVTQVCDWIFIKPDLSDYSTYGNTGAFQGLFPGKGHHMLGNTGRMKSLCIMTADEAPDDFAPEGWARHFFQGHCSPEWQEILYPDPPQGINACHINFTHGLNRLPAIHAIKDVAERRRVVNSLANNHNFQTFQVCHHAVKGNQTVIELGGSPPVPHGTGVEFFANTDLYAVISNCPGANMWNPSNNHSGKIGTASSTRWPPAVERTSAREPSSRSSRSRIPDLRAKSSWSTVDTPKNRSELRPRAHDKKGDHDGNRC